MRARALAAAAIALVAVLCAQPAAARASARLPPIKHVFVIVLENKGFDETFGANSPAPYLSLTLPSMGALVPNYYGVTHESLGNYIALASGQGSNPITQADCQTYVNMVPGTIGANGQAIGMGCVYPPSVKTVADQLSAAHLRWKGYMEDMANAPGQAATCRHPALGARDTTQSARKGDQYAARHNPFVYFHSLLDSGACSRFDVPLTQLPVDLRSAATTPNYSFITPNLCNDGHDSPCVDHQPGGLVGANAFLRSWVPRIIHSPGYQDGGMLVVTFDEAEINDSSACCGELQFPNTANNGFIVPGRGGGRTGAVILSPYIDPGTVDNIAYNHFSLLRSVEDLFGLSHLGYAGQAGLRALGSDLFTCYRPGRPRPRHGRLPTGSEIKLAVIGQGTAARPSVEIKLWHPGRVRVSVSPIGGHRRRAVGSAHALSACQPLSVRLPYAHGNVTVSAAAFGAVERRTISF